MVERRRPPHYPTISERNARTLEAVVYALRENGLSAAAVLERLAEAGVKDGCLTSYVYCKGDKTRYTALHASCLEGHSECARLLCEHGAVIDQVTSNGTTPLYAACMYGHVDCALLLCGLGATIDKADCNRCTPLYAAAQRAAQTARGY